MSVNEQGQPANPSAPDLMGYGSVEELVKAKRASDAELKRIAERLETVETQVQETRQQVPQRSATGYSGPASELDAMGIPVQALDAYFTEKFTTQLLEPLAKLSQQQGQARSYMMATYGEDFSATEPKVRQFVASDPQLNERYQRMSATDPASADELAYLRYRKAHPQQSRPDPERVAEAAIPSQRQGDSRDTSAQEQEAIAKLRQRAFETGSKGDIQRFASARLRQAISKRFYESGHPG